jgi:hypothetical protein
MPRVVIENISGEGIKLGECGYVTDNELGKSYRFVLRPNEYVFTKMVNAERHELFYQFNVNSTSCNKRISSFPSLVGTNLRVHFALLEGCTYKPARLLAVFPS